MEVQIFIDGPRESQCC